MDGSVPVASEIRDELARLLGNPLFARADRARRFLRFTVETTLAGNSGSLKETVIGVEVFDRAPGYDPGADPIVRVEARRIRAKLERYYATHGRASAIRIAIPSPGYVPVFSRVAETAPVVAAHVGVAAPHTRQPWILAVGFAIAVLAAAAVIATSRHGAPPVLSGRRFTAHEGYETGPAFSPNGRRIAFVWGGPDRAGDQIYFQRHGHRSSRARRLVVGGR